MTTQSSPGLKIWLMLLSLGVIWGASFMGSKMALTGFGPLTVAAGRISIGAVLLTAIAYTMGRRLPGFSSKTDLRIWLHCLGMAIASNALPFTLLSWGQLHVSSGFAGITMAVVPLLVLPLAHFLIPGDRMSRRKFIGFVIGFFGVIVLIGPAAFGNSGAEQENLARIACIAAACCYASGSIITRLCPPTPVMGFSAAALLLASLIMIPLSLYFEGTPALPDSTALAGILYLGIMPTAVATVLLVQIINSAGPTFLVLVNYQVPVWAVIFGVLLLNETLPGQFIGALSLILLGLAISQARRLRFR
ncbi:MAG: DMT family transporter [Rhodobacteraceae bacterium]|nr:DMT family transporter [Paracoccaceae bacterium]